MDINIRLQTYLYIYCIFMYLFDYHAYECIVTVLMYMFNTIYLIDRLNFFI